MSATHAIYILENVIDKDTCNTLIELIDKYAVPENSIVQDTNVTADLLMLPTIMEFNEDLYISLNNKLTNIFETVAGMMRDKEGLIITGNSGYQFRKITGETTLHRDGTISEYKDHIVSTKNLRILSIIIALNDYDGGELYFPRQQLAVKLKRGQAVLFPPYWTHPHGARVPTNGTVRYTINSWMHGR